ncbi:chloride channel [Schizophyllum commune]
MEETAPPTPPAWRRERLLRIGSSFTVNLPADIEREHADATLPSVSPHEPPTDTERTPLRRPAPQERSTSYGALPTQTVSSISRLGRRRHIAHITIPGRKTYSTPPSPDALRSPSLSRSVTDRFRRLSQRPISAYDAPLVKDRDHADADADLDAKINGIRVWYSSFTSIDWLHDAIKDSVRFSRLRRRHSVRARVRLAFDKSLGWIMVTIVGFLTAVVAFLVVRAEQWLFDLKEGYCSTNWTKAQRFCCPPVDETVVNPLEEAACPAWRTWEDVFHGSGGTGDLIEYASYTIVALFLAFLSCILTLYLTKSTTFVTRKESGILSPAFEGDEPKDKPAAPKRKVMYYAAGSGIPEIKTILSGFVIHGYLGGRTLFTKSVGLALSVASGLSLGKEGPFVHIASCIGNIVSRVHNKYENNEAKRREILSAACAAGVAVAFGAPIGGTLFSLEEVSYFFPPKVMWRSFFCAMIAALTLRTLDPFGTGKLVLFQVTYDKDWHLFELFPFLLLGVFGGVYGAYFSKLNVRWAKYVRNGTWIKNHPIIEVLLTTLITACLCFLNPYTRMGGTELVYNLFAECRTGSGNTHSGLCVVDPGAFAAVWPVARAILVAMVVKGALTIVTFGIKVPAGIFIPTLGVGACAGRVLGIAMQWHQMQSPEGRLYKACAGDLDCIIPGLYAMVGAAAALSGVTRTTVSLAVIMFELTDTLTYAVPVMLAVLVAKTVADALEPKGIYDLVIDVQQLPYLDAKHTYLWGNVQVGDVLRRDVPAIKLDEKQTVESLRDMLVEASASGDGDGGFPILRRDAEMDGYRMVGYIGANELEHALTLVADSADSEVQFTQNWVHHSLAASSISSLLEHGAGGATREYDPFDFSPYMDQAPLLVAFNSPLELVHQFFVKLGARYVVVNDADGLYEGVIDKKTWLAFLSELEEK